ncbi:MAG: hypothetical protein FJ011_22160 [Chloroflexi bacterium]|nr:hypothetical protein [Chloroflexota bacterium]
MNSLRNTSRPRLPIGAMARRLSRVWMWLARRVSAVQFPPALRLTLILLVPACLPLAAPGYFFDAHDAHHSVFFLVEFDQAIRDGVLWPVWGPDHALGFGYPLWLVYAPLAYYVAEAFHLLGLGFTAAVKATWALSFVVGALGMYRLARRWWGDAVGLVAAMAYTYAPYHLVQIYVRAALAEFVALAWFPWVLLAFAELWDAPRLRQTVRAALAFAALLLTHTVSSLIFAPLLIAFLATKWVGDLAAARRRTHDAKREAKLTGDSRPPTSNLQPPTSSLQSLVFGVLLAAIFIVPMLFERRYIVEAQWVHDTYNYRQHFVYPSQFFSPDWGFGYSVKGPGDGMSFQIGLLPFIAALVGIIGSRAQTANCRLQIADQKPPISRLRSPVSSLLSPVPPLFLAAVTVVAIFAMTPASQPIWDALPLVGLIQFPWRLLAITTITLALLAAAGAHWLSLSDSEQPAPVDDRTSPYVYLLALAFVAASLPYTRPELRPIRPQDESAVAIIEFETKHPDMRGMTRWAERMPADADSPLIAQYLAGQPLQRAAIVAGEGVILEQQHTGASGRAHVQAQSGVRLRFYTYFFPGWRVEVNGRPAEIAADPPNGLIGLTLPAGEHEVRLRFGATPLRRAAAIISLSALVGLLVLWLIGARDERSARPPGAGIR